MIAEIKILGRMENNESGTKCQNWKDGKERLRKSEDISGELTSKTIEKCSKKTKQNKTKPHIENGGGGNYTS